LEPSLFCGDDLVRIGFPEAVVLFDEPVDGRLRVYQRVKDTALQSPAGQLSEEASTAFSHEDEIVPRDEV